MMFADVPTSQVTAAWIVGAAGFAAMANQILKLVDRFKDKPAPGEVMRDSVDRFTTKAEFKDHVAEDKQEHRNIWNKLGGMERGAGDRMDSLSKEWRGFVEEKFREMQASSDNGREKLHDRINEILSEVSELRGRMK